MLPPKPIRSTNLDTFDTIEPVGIDIRVCLPSTDHVRSRFNQQELTFSRKELLTLMVK
jgi:hypothetical protein